MITPAEFIKYLEIFNVPFGGGGEGGSVSKYQVQQSAFNFKAATGSNDAFVVTLSPVPAALTDGMLVTMYSGSLVNLTTSPTLNVNGLGPISIQTWWGGIAAGDIQTGVEYFFIYNAHLNVFQLMNPSISTADTFQVQANGYQYALDSGIANAYIANVLPVQMTILGGFGIIMQAIHNNTGASTLTVNGTTHAIVNSAGGALSGGEILANGIYSFIYNNSSSSFTLLNSSLSPEIPGVTSITGTANQIIASSATGAVTLSLPQSIATTSSPTFSALTLTSPLTGANGGTGVNNGSNTLTLAGNLDTSGDYASTFTMTAATSVTFPTSGTLATTSQTISWLAQATNSVTATVNTGYYVTSAGSCNITLPSAVAAGSIVAVAGGGAPGWTLIPNSGQTLKIVTGSTSTGISSSNIYDCIEAICFVANTTWVVRSFVSNGLTYS